MPLIKSAAPAAIGQNIKAEIGAGKPQKEAVAIAESVKDKALGLKLPAAPAMPAPAPTAFSDQEAVVGGAKVPRERIGYAPIGGKKR
jgi:hypothetical protein